ncbi:MAG: hypothetical protein J5742_01580 [Alphaproteobacteria bacterium]|nr:hypothetical protein [Alphaproteobacteria bacterium]
MQHKNKTFSPYPNYLCRKALRFVFNTVKFDDPYMACLVYDSYLWNLGIMREYARDHNIDEMAYILSIRDTLLKSFNVHDYEYK